MRLRENEGTDRVVEGMESLLAINLSSRGARERESQRELPNCRDSPFFPFHYSERTNGRYRSEYSGDELNNKLEKKNDYKLTMQRNKWAKKRMKNTRPFTTLVILSVP